MNVIYKYLDIICKDSSGEEIKIYSYDYDESIDEIKVRTNIRATKLEYREPSTPETMRSAGWKTSSKTGVSPE